ncbi:MAG: NIPSNAP family protein [Pseudorhizobium sp.]
MNMPDMAENRSLPRSEGLDTACVIELRRYRLRPGGREGLIDLFDREFVEAQEETGIHVLGQFRDLDDPDSFVWLRGFGDINVRERTLRDFYSGPVWAKHCDAANGAMVNSDNVLLLRPVAPFDPQWVTDTARPPRDAKGSRPGLVVVTVAHLAPRTEDAFANFFGRKVSPILNHTGAVVLGTFVVERSENTFPNLPVREGETLFIWFSLFRDEVAHDAHVGALAALREWKEHLLPEMDARVWRPNEVCRLAPTARSLLHGENLISLSYRTPRQGSQR